MSVFRYLETGHCCGIGIGDYDGPGHDKTDIWRVRRLEFFCGWGHYETEIALISTFMGGLNGVSA